MARTRRPNPVFSEDYAVLRTVLIEARRVAGLSQRDLARRLEKWPSYIAMIESGQRRIDGLDLFRLNPALIA
jgi:transcriptional regulator with XRE-family HTH domain